MRLRVIDDQLQPRDLREEARASVLERVDDANRCRDVERRDRRCVARTGAPACASTALTPIARRNVLLPDMFDPLTTRSAGAPPPMATSLAIAVAGRSGCASDVAARCAPDADVERRETRSRDAPRQTSPARRTLRMRRPRRARPAREGRRGAATPSIASAQCVPHSISAAESRRSCRARHASRPTSRSRWRNLRRCRPVVTADRRCERLQRGAVERFALQHRSRLGDDREIARRRLDARG